MGTRSALVCVVAWLAVTAVAHAGASDDDLHAARVALARLDYPEALDAADRAWRHGASAPARVRELCALAGRAAASMGDVAAARLWFARWRYVDPAAELPPGTSSKLVRIFDDARRELRGAALGGTAIRRADTVELALAPDPLGMISGARVGGRVRPVVRGAATRVPWDGQASELELLDEHANVLGAIAMEEPVLELAQAERVEAVPATRWYARWQPWAGTAAAAALVGGVGLYVAYQADRHLDELAVQGSSALSPEVASELARLDRSQWLARIGLGVAVVSGTVAAWRHARERSRRGTLAVAPLAGGAAVLWSIAR